PGGFGAARFECARSDTRAVSVRRRRAPRALRAGRRSRRMPRAGSVAGPLMPALLAEHFVEQVGEFLGEGAAFEALECRRAELSLSALEALEATANAAGDALGSSKRSSLAPPHLPQEPRIATCFGHHGENGFSCRQVLEGLAGDDVLSVLNRL